MNDASKIYYDFLTANPKADNATKGIEALKCLNKVDDEIKAIRTELNVAEKSLVSDKYDNAATKENLATQRELATCRLGILKCEKTYLTEALAWHATKIVVDNYMLTIPKEIIPNLDFKPLTQFASQMYQIAKTKPQLLRHTLEQSLNCIETYFLKPELQRKREANQHDFEAQIKQK